jgi:inner membrane transporter RhtA
VARVLHRAPPAVLVVVAALSVQLGAALATTLFDEAGPLGAVLLRVGMGAAVLLAFYGRRLRRLRGLPLRPVLALGLVLAVMNSLFYASLDRIPLGVAVTFEFLGPLAVAVALSRHLRDLLWVALAGAGVALLGSPTVDVDKAGLAFAAGAGACWAAYIVVTKRVSHTWPVGPALTVSMAVAALLLLPVGLAFEAERLGSPALLGVGLGVALLSSVVPYALELLAIRRVTPSTFSVLLSLEPALAAVVGLAALGQELELAEWLAVAFVVAASAGASLGAVEAPPPEA